MILGPAPITLVYAILANKCGMADYALVINGLVILGQVFREVWLQMRGEIPRLGLFRG